MRANSSHLLKKLLKRDFILYAVLCLFKFANSYTDVTNTVITCQSYAQKTYSERITLFTFIALKYGGFIFAEVT